MDDGSIREPGTKGRLFKAAVLVFAARGYEAATVREICARAEANVAAVNYYFGDKENLYRQVVAEIFRAAARTRAPLLPRDADPVDRLRAHIRASFQEILPVCHEEHGVDQEQCLAMGVIFLVELARPTQALDDIVENYIGPDCDELRDILRTLAGRDLPPRLLNMCMASVTGQVLHYYYSYPIIQRLLPDKGAYIKRPEFLDLAVEHVLQFSLGGLERVLGRGGASS
ncbi:CerR family C-terminal domain-containing protein [Desulfocurvus sp. DL9XJH121]